MLEILPLLVFTTCGGIAAGAYVLAALASACMPGGLAIRQEDATPGVADAGVEASGAAKGFDANRVWLFPLVCIALLAVGLLGTLMHLGQPLRFMNGMGNPASMISQESYWAIAFGILMVIDCLLAKAKGRPMLVVRLLAAVAACGLMFVTGLAYYDCAFIVPWAGAITIPLFIVGDLAMGAALLMIFAPAESQRCLHILNVATCAAWLAVAAAYGVYGGDLQMQVGPIVAGAILGPVAAAGVSIACIQGKVAGKSAAIAVTVCAVLGVILVRGAFFAAGVIV